MPYVDLEVAYESIEDALTGRQKEVFQCIRKGWPDWLIAVELGIKKQTVYVYKKRMMDKLRKTMHLINCDSIEEFIRYLVNHGAYCLSDLLYDGRRYRWRKSKYKRR